MARDALVTLVALRRFEERQALAELARRRSAANAARDTLGAPPAAIEASGEMLFATLDERRAASGMQWATWGARLGRAEQAAGAEDRSLGEWRRAAADLRATQRLLERRAARRALESTRRVRSELDEVGLTRWRRDRETVVR